MLYTRYSHFDSSPPNPPIAMVNIQKTGHADVVIEIYKVMVTSTREDEIKTFNFMMNDDVVFPTTITHGDYINITFKFDPCNSQEGYYLRPNTESHSPYDINTSIGIIKKTF